MIRATTIPSARRGAIKPSTVFAATVAIVAGLVGAFLFKKFVLDKPNTAMAQTLPNQPQTMRELTVANGNLTICPIDPLSLKKVKVTNEEYNEIVRKFNPNGTRQMLVGDQPVRRIPVTPIKSDEPIFEDQLEALHFPTTLGERVRPGMRAINIQVPADRAMFQVNDNVDVMATLMHDAFGPNGGTTACMAPGRRVLARFGTIYPVCCPDDRSSPTRNFTIEVTPCEFSRMTLARTLGAAFELSVSTRPAQIEDESIRAASTGEEGDGDCCTATLKDLEEIFRIPQRPEKKEPKQGKVEMYVGTKLKDSMTYQLPEETPVVSFRSKAPEARPTPKKNPITPASGVR